MTPMYSTYFSLRKCEGSIVEAAAQGERLCAEVETVKKPTYQGDSVN